MMKNKKNVPDIRFKGFAEEWDKQIMADIGNPFNGLSGKTKEDFGHGDAKFITYMNVFSNPIADLCGIGRVEVDNKQNSIQYGDVLFTVSSETPEEVGMSSVWLGQDDNVYLNSFCFGYRLTTHKDPYYIAYLLRSKPIRKEIAFLAQGISRYNISKNRVMEIELPFPNSIEQQAIGNYFQNIDRLINTSQTKLDKLKNIKKACLEKMFPRNGSTTPELRFKGFSEEWKEKEMSIVAIFNPKSELPEVFEYVDLESVVGTEMISHREESKLTAPSRAQRLAKQGDLFYQTVRPYQRNNHLFDKDIDNYVFSTGYAQLRPYGNGYFLLSLVQGELFVKTVLDNCTGTSYPAISSTDLAKIKVSIPKYDEQKTIGSLFKNLDILIAKTELQINKLKNIKKACLDKMFVNTEDKI